MRSPFSVTGLAQKWCPISYPGRHPEDCFGCKKVVSAVREALEEAEKSFQAIAILRVDHPDNMRVAKKWAEDAIAALKGAARDG